LSEGETTDTTETVDSYFDHGVLLG
jgi:hypothetical protein